MMLERTIKLKLVPLDTESRGLTHDLLRKCVELLVEAQKLVVELDVRSVRRAHQELYRLSSRCGGKKLKAYDALRPS